MPDTSGPMWHRQFAFYDPASSCWRTSQATFLSGSDEFSETWPKRGTTRAGSAYALPMSELPTVEPESSSRRVLATPTAWLGRRAAHSIGDPQRWTNPERSNELSDQIAHLLLPTPRVTVRGPDANRESRPDAGPPTLHDIVQLLPTPRATDGTKGGPNQRGSSGDLMLPSAVMLLPTPTSQNAHGNGRNGRGELLLPGIAQSIGAPTSPPSPDGDESSDAPPPDLLSLLLEAEDSD